MKFEIVKGLPTADEIVAIEVAMKMRKRETPLALTKRSTYGLPQLRKPMSSSFRFGLKN